MSTEAAARREELLRRYLGGAAPARAGDEITRADRSAPPAMSFTQQRMWFVDQLRRAPGEYLIPVGWRIRGPLQAGALRAAWDEVTRRHEVTRTRYGQIDGRPVQIVDPVCTAGFTVADLRGLPRADRDDAAAAWAGEQLGIPFDLATQHPFRLRLMRVADDEHVLVLVAHHIAFDGWSTAVLAAELGTHYRAAVEGVPPARDVPAVQYADFAAWQRDRVAGPATAAQLAWWRTRLAGLTPVELPADRARPAEFDPRGETCLFTVPAQLAAAATALGRQHRATPFMVLLAVYQLMVARYTGQSDIAVGTPVAGRTSAQLHHLIGAFLNTVVLRARVGAGTSFTELLAQVRQVTLDALARQDVPFEQLVEELGVPRDLGRNPLFPTMFVLQNTARAGFSAAGVVAAPLPLRWHSAKFDLTMYLTEEPDGSISGVLEYPTALFDAATVERMAGHYLTLLRGAVAEPGTDIAALPILTAPERERLTRWNETAVAYPAGRTLDDLVRDQVAATPAATAVIAGDVELTYADLDRRVEGLAARLAELGAGPESVVGVCLDRSAELVVALLAVLRAGAAYLPLDPGYPAARLAHMLTDSGVAVVIGPPRPALDGFTGTLVDPAETADTPSRVRPHESNAAYVIYTSGSTGRPKGVVVEHRGIVNRLRWMQHTYHLAPHDRILQKTPYSFDVSVWEFFWPLISGATLVPAAPGGHRDPAYLARTIIGEQITTIHFVPSMLRAFLAALDVPLPSLRRVICSGEALDPDLAEACLSAIGAELHNLYGPTEASVDVTAAPCRPGEPVTIGRPIANTRAHILDAGLRPVPVGTAGQLCLAGVQLARGYHGRPALTAERFVPDPDSPRPGGRLYLTGDLARHRADGAIEYRGRLDHQVKVNGHRIELGEVEAALRAHPGVQAAAVAVHRGALVGYVVSGTPVDAGGLRDHLARTLPGHMVPARWVALDRLPLSPSGKVDRAALPAPDGRRPLLGTAYRPAGDADEQRLAALWEQVLGIAPIGRDDPFTELGGQSLDAATVAARMRAESGVPVGVADVLSSTVAGLAAAVRDRAGRGAAPAAIPALGSARQPLSHAQERMWLVQLMHPGSTMYVMTEAYRCDGDLDLAALRRALAATLARHDQLRARFGAERGRPFLTVPAADGHPADIVVHTGAADVDDARRAVRELAATPVDLATGPLLRLVVVPLGARRFVLAAVVHHIVSDDTSMALFWRDLGAAYAGGGDGLPALPVRYPDYAAWQREHLSPAHLRYWCDRLTGAPPVLELPADRPRGARAAPVEATLEFSLAPAVVAGLRATAAVAGATDFMVLLAVFVRWLQLDTGRSDLVVATFTGNRDHPDLRDVVGLFVNTLALRFRCPAHAAFADLLAEVRREALAGYTHGETPFDQVVAALRPPRDLTRHPIAQVALQYLGSLDGRVDLPGVRATPLGSVQGGTPFDLMVTLRDAGDGLAGTLHYRPDLFDAATAAGFAARYRALAEQVASLAGVAA